MANPLLLRSLFSSARKSLSSRHSPRSIFVPRAFFSASSSASASASFSDPNASLDPTRLRNVAVIAHVDHGKTTLMDRLLRQCGADIPHERAMDSITLERERGITISSKVTSVAWKENELNMVDTPGHADFGGEVERVVGMVEGAILVVDAGEGPLAQTKFVLAKALKYGLRPILLLNKVDRPSVSEERCNEVESLVFDLFANLGATEEQLDFPVLYASAKEGWASSTFTKDPPADVRNMAQLLDAVVRHVPPPTANLEAPFQMLVSMMEKDFYLGRILTGRVSSGIIRVGDKIHGLRITDSGTQKVEEGKVVKLMKKKGTSMIMIDSAGAGDIISMAGLANPSIGHTVSSTEVMTALPTVELDPPTISMTFSVNDSPLAGRDGTHLTGGKIGDRLIAEAETNLAINVLPGLSESYEVQGRGELQLGILIENMRREGFELSVSPPKVMYKVEKGKKLEPLEEVTIEVNEEHVGLVMEALSHRRAEVIDMGPVPGHVGRTRMSLTCPSRGLVGYRSVFSSDTRGTGFMHRAFLTYAEHRGPLTLEESVKIAISNKSYSQVVELLDHLKQPWQRRNPFSFLFTMPLNLRTQIIDQMLQSFTPLRPRHRPQTVYACLLLGTLQSSDPLPLALAILQRTLRSGCAPVPQTHLLLSSAWLDHRSKSLSVASVLKEMQLIGYRLDSGTCNYVISSLCVVDQLKEGVNVLKGMGQAGCLPDCDSYGIVIDAMCSVKNTVGAAKMMKEMVGKSGLTPRQGTIVKLSMAFRAKKETLKAFYMIEFLEREGVPVGFESYELAIEGCLECCEFVLAGKISMRMAGRGFIPYIRIRQKLVRGLADVDECELSSVVRQRFLELGS